MHRLLLLAGLALFVGFGAALPASAQTAAPRVTFLVDDTNPESASAGGILWPGIFSELTSQMVRGGLDVHPEAVAGLRSGPSRLTASGLTSLISDPRLRQAVEYVVALSLLSTVGEQDRVPRIHLAAQVIDLKTLGTVASVDPGEMRLPPLPGECTIVCLREQVGSGANVVATQVGKALATKIGYLAGR